MVVLVIAVLHAIPIVLVGIFARKKRSVDIVGAIMCVIAIASGAPAFMLADLIAAGLTWYVVRSRLASSHRRKGGGTIARNPTLVEPKTRLSDVPRQAQPIVKEIATPVGDSGDGKGQLAAGKRSRPPVQPIPIGTDWWIVMESPSAPRTILAIGYRIGMSQDDAWTVRFNNFKYNRGASVRKAVAVVEAAARSLFRRLEINPGETTVVPVLRSSETTASPSSHNSLLAKGLAKSVGAHLRVDFLTKDVHASLHHQPDALARDAVLAKANYRAGKLGTKHVVIVDDIVTRGQTLRVVAVAIKRTNPAVSVHGFVLGRHQREEWLRVPFEEANSKIPQELARIWDST